MLTTRCLALLAAVCLLLLQVGCGSDDEKINIVRLSGLGGPERIDFYEFQHESGVYLLRAGIEGESPVDEFIEALAEPMELGENVRCIEDFHMHVVMPGGRREIFELVCSGEPDLIRGDQVYFAGQAARVPEEVTRLLNAALDRSETLAPLASDAAVPVVANKLLQDFPQLDQFRDLDFRRNDLSAGMSEASRAAYTSSFWSVDVSWPAVPEPVFEVAVSVRTANFAWNGQIYRGEVTPVPAASALRVEPRKVFTSLPGQEVVLLATVAEREGIPSGETYLLSASAPGAEVSIDPAVVTAGRVAEVIVIPGSSSMGKALEITVSAERDDVVETARAEVVVLDFQFPVNGELEAAAAERRDVFIDWLAESRPDLGVTRETAWTPRVIKPGILVVSHYTYFSEEWELGIMWHVTIPPHDWAEIYLRDRDSSLVPDVAFKIDSWTEQTEPHEIEAPEEVDR